MYLLDRAGLELSLYSPWFFRNVTRPLLKQRCTDGKGDVDYEKVHEKALRLANRHVDTFRRHESRFYFPELEVDINGMRFVPFGTAAGMDKNAHALLPFSYVYGFQTVGTDPLYKREGNDRPRVAVDEASRNAYNAQGFPHEGHEQMKKNLAAYCSGAKKPVIASICGLPHVVRECLKHEFVPNKNRLIVREEPGWVVYKEFADIKEDEVGRALENAYVDAADLFDELAYVADGFEWNPFSPNTKTLGLLRRPDVVRSYAELGRRHVGGKLLMVKIGPYEPEDADKSLALQSAFLAGGGNGITEVNTLIVPKEKVPSKEWGYPTAGKSGADLKQYRMRAVKDTRNAFPDAVIFAAGGLEDGDDVYETFLAGADAVEGYTPNMFNGPGLVRKQMKCVSERLRIDGFKNLQQLREQR